MKKKIISILVVLALCAGILPLKAPLFADDGGIRWNGTENYYEISNYSGLKEFAKIVNGVSTTFTNNSAANARLVADIYSKKLSFYLMN